VLRQSDVECSPTVVRATPEPQRPAQSPDFHDELHWDPPGVAQVESRTHLAKALAQQIRAAATAQGEIADAHAVAVGGAGEVGSSAAGEEEGDSAAKSKQARSADSGE